MASARKVFGPASISLSAGSMHRRRQYTKRKNREDWCLTTLLPCPAGQPSAVLSGHAGSMGPRAAGVRRRPRTPLLLALPRQLLRCCTRSVRLPGLRRLRNRPARLRFAEHRDGDRTLGPSGMARVDQIRVKILHKVRAHGKMGKQRRERQHAYFVQGKKLFSV